MLIGHQPKEFLLSVEGLTVSFDGFKAVNDTYGHLSGDHVLVEVAARFRHCVRNSNVAARLAGNEFTVMLTGSGSEEHAVALSR